MRLHAAAAASRRERLREEFLSRVRLATAQRTPQRVQAMR